MPTHTLPFPLLLHNGFTRRWPCSNEVWSFCDATGKLPRGTVLSILVHHLQFLTAQIHLHTHLALFVLSTGTIQTNFHQTPWNNCETRLISWCNMLRTSTFVLIVFCKCFKLESPTCFAWFLRCWLTRMSLNEFEGATQCCKELVNCSVQKE